VKPVAFAYVRARTLEEAIACLAGTDGEAKLLAGGQSLTPMLNMRLVRPATLVDINRLPGLDRVERDADGILRIGALVRHTDLLRSPLARAHGPLLVEAARHIGHRAIRNRGTVGGSLAHADPAAELPAAAVALDARVSIEGAAGAREVDAADFFQGLFTTALRADEILTGVHVPPADGARWGFAEVARRAGDFALAGVAVVTRAPAGTCTHARVVAFGVGPTPARLRSAEALVVGARIDEAVAHAAGEAAAAECAPTDDVHASASYRRHLVAVLTARAVLQAAAGGA
jgi:carbon-monoxide dehydrogenase medium subunit